MKLNKRLLPAIAIFFFTTATAQNKIVMHAAQAKDTINKNIYGHFAFEKPNAITPKAFNSAKINGTEMDVTLPPFSVIVLALN